MRTALAPPDTETARTRLLDAAEELFSARGIQSVGMDARRGSGTWRSSSN
jgi:AcrR family transcriptional regulator